MDDSCHACYIALMPSYTTDQWTALRQTYLDAASEIVAEGGWQALGIRALGQRVGRTGTAINRVFNEQSLRLALVNRAFASMLSALPPSRPKSDLRSDPYTCIVRHIRDYPVDAALMVQVAAQAGLTSAAASEIAVLIAEHGDGLLKSLQTTIRRCRSTTVPNAGSTRPNALSTAISAAALPS